MRLLLDTHALLWWGAGDPRLGPSASQEIRRAANEVYVSAVSAIEISIKHRIGKLPGVEGLVAAFESEVTALGFKPLAITLGHAALAGRMAIAHKDPFDRLLIAQSMAEDMALVSNEALFDGFGVTRLW